MQGLWYGDRRDRVKWGALAHLASRFRLVSILQVAYFRDGWASSQGLRADKHYGFRATATPTLHGCALGRVDLPIERASVIVVQLPFLVECLPCQNGSSSRARSNC